MSKRLYCSAIVLSAVTYNANAWATTFNLEPIGPGRDPSENFDEECLGDATDESCDARAAAMEAELLDTLISLERDDSPTTVQLFQSALSIDSPQLQTIALQYLSRLDVTDDVLSAARSFLFGTEPRRGATAAQLLSNSTAADSDVELAKLYKEQRPLSAYEPRSESYADQSKEPLVIACSNDGRLNLMASFTEEEQYEGAQRLLIYDRFVSDRLDLSTNYPVTAFVTDDTVDDVVDHFTIVFGKKPYPTASESQAQIQNASVQIASLQSAILSGDTAAIKKLQQLSEQLQVAQTALSVGASLQLQTVHAQEDVFWVDAESTELSNGPMPRGVSVGEDALLGKTVIRYFNANVSGSSPVGGVSNPSPGGTGGPAPDSAGSDAGVPSTPGSGSENASDAGSNKKHSSCSLPTPGQTPAGFFTLAFAFATGALIRRRQRIAR